MKYLSFLFFIPFFSLFIISHSYTQCIPDAEGCEDINEPGQICPDILPEAYAGVYYEETVTVWPPYEATIGNTTIEIYKIIIDSIGNIPPGIDYEINATDLYPDTAYCVLISGTPTTAGTYTLYIRVIPYVLVNEVPVELSPQIDDTSLTVTINPANNLSLQSIDFFDVIECSPNPFIDQSKIGFKNPIPETVELQIYSIQGKLMYTEKLHARAGINYFSFNGRNLEGGIYIYKISNTAISYSGKFIKIE